MGIFYIKASSLEQREALSDYLRRSGITAAFHYMPLHTAEQGQRCGCFVGEDRYTTDTSRRLLRLPMYEALTDAQVDRVCEAVYAFYGME